MMNEAAPKVVVLAGPNGAGKSTSAARLLRQLKVEEFVNADTIAQGLSAFAQERVAFQAGRIMLGRLSELASIRASFGFETTLASRSYAPRLKRLRAYPKTGGDWLILRCPGSKMCLSPSPRPVLG